MSAAARRRSLKDQRDSELRRQYGTIGKRASEAASHNQRMADFVARARAARRNAPPKPALGFYTDARRPGGDGGADRTRHDEAYMR